jgi:hypothetical protein
VRIVVGHAKTFRGIVWTIDPVANVCLRGEGLEAMQKPGRYIEVTHLDIVEMEGFELAEAGRILSDIDEHIVHRTVSTPDQFGLAAAGPAVHSTYDSTHGSGLRVLHESCGCSLDPEGRVKYVGIEGPCEKSTIVPERFGTEDKNVGKIGGFYAHGLILACSQPLGIV